MSFNVWEIIANYVYISSFFCNFFTKGVLQADPGVIREYDHIFRLYCHECQRIFHDRLVDRTDKVYFNTMLSEMAAKHFSKVSVILMSWLFIVFFKEGFNMIVVH